MCVISQRTLLKIVPVHIAFKRTISAELKAKLAAERKKLRDEFKEKEKEWESQVNLSLLRHEDLQIYEAHKTAVRSWHFTYDDPETGNRVMTRLRHFYRGSCCGNACRHCTYEHANVAEIDKARRVYNSAFWVDKDSRPDLVLKSASTDSSQSDGKDWFTLRHTNEEETYENIDPLLFKH